MDSLVASCCMGQVTLKVTTFPQAMDLHVAATVVRDLGQCSEPVGECIVPLGRPHTRIFPLQRPDTHTKIFPRACVRAGVRAYGRACVRRACCQTGFTGISSHACPQGTLCISSPEVGCGPSSSGRCLSMSAPSQGCRLQSHSTSRAD